MGGEVRREHKCSDQCEKRLGRPGKEHPARHRRAWGIFVPPIGHISARSHRHHGSIRGSKPNTGRPFVSVGKGHIAFCGKAQPLPSGELRGMGMKPFKSPSRNLLAASLIILSLGGPAAAQDSRRSFYTPPTADTIHSVPAEHGMVVAQEKIAARIGTDILKRGGNAVDAAVAAGFAMAVTYP